MLVKGRLSEIAEKHGKSARGPWTLYSLVIETDEGVKRLGAGFDKPKASVGTVVSVQASENDRGYLDADLSTLEVMKGEEAEQVSSRAVARGAKADDSRQRSIVTQTSYKVAADILPAMVESGAIKIPTKNGQEVWLRALEQTAQDIFDRCIGGFTKTEDTTTEPDGDSEGGEGEYDPLS